MLSKREQIKKNNLRTYEMPYVIVALKRTFNCSEPDNIQYSCFFKRHEYEMINFLIMYYEMDHCHALSDVMALNLWSYCLFYIFVLYVENQAS